MARFVPALDAVAPRGQIALAVSGGPDSLALLLLTNAARPGRVVAATVDHSLRPDAAAEAAMVAALCGALVIPHATLAVTVTDKGDGLQAAAREARYAALTHWARDEGASALATAHHMDDQAETVLMRLARGSGVAGLAGIRAMRAMGGGLTLARPLLGWRKAKLVALCAAAGLDPVDDPSNRDTRFDRTQARALLAQGHFTSERLAGVAAKMAEAEAALDWQLQRLTRERIEGSSKGIKLDVAGLPRELRRRLLIAALAKAAPDARPPRGDDVDRLLDRLDAGDISTLGGVRIETGRPWTLTTAPPRRST